MNRADRRWQTPALLALILLGGGALRIYAIDSQSFWIDEADIYIKATQPNIAAVVGPHFGFPDPPLHQVILHYWLKLNPSDANARLLSAAVATATIPLFYRLFATLFTPCVGILAATLLAINPFHIWYSQEARMYSIFLFLATLATFLVWKAVEEPTWKRWAVYGISIILCGLTHTITLFLALAHGLFVALEQRRQILVGRFVATYAGVGLVLLPIVLAWAGALYNEPSRQIDKPVSIWNLGYVFFAQSVGFSFGPSIYELQANPAVSAVAPYWKEVGITALVFMVPLAAGVANAWKNGSKGHHQKFFLLTSVLLLPALALFLIDAMGSTTMNPRHAITTLIPYVGFLALGIRSLGGRIGVAVFLAIAILSSVALTDFYFNPRYAKEDARSAAAYLATLEGDHAIALVLTYPDPIRHYYDGPIKIVGPRGLLRENRRGLERKLRALVNERAELLLVDLRGWHSDPGGRIAAACERMFKHIATRALHGITIARYRIPKHFSRLSSPGLTRIQLPSKPAITFRTEPETGVSPPGVL